MSVTHASGRGAEGAWELAMVHDEPATSATPSVAARVAIALLGFYRRFISPALPRACRFYPTCSAYALEAVTRYGFLRGIRMAAIRLCKCHPLHKGGFDPVK
jgi:putative membrane protein insertion efficiency factor